MAPPMGASKGGVPRLDFDRPIKLEFHGSKVTSVAGLLAYRGWASEIAGGVLTDTRRGKNGRHVGQVRQSVFGHLGGYADVNDAEFLFNPKAPVGILESPFHFPY